MIWTFFNFKYFIQDFGSKLHFLTLNVELYGLDIKYMAFDKCYLYGYSIIDCEKSKQPEHKKIEVL